MKAKRRRHDATFKARVALEELKGIKIIQQIAKEYEVHPGQVAQWKTIVSERLPDVFERGAGGGQGEDFVRERDYGLKVNRKRLRRLRQKMGVEAIWCRPRTSIANKSHQKYPYLLRNLIVSRPEQV